MTYRAFIAIGISDELRASIRKIQGKLKEAGARVGWADVQNMHLTLAFLGDTLESNIAPLGEALDRVAEGIAPFSFSVEGVGLFGPVRAPRIIWVGVREVPRPMMQLHETLTKALRAQGLPVEERPFKPHITLGRIRSAHGVDALTSLLASVRNSEFGAVQVDRVVLMRSRLDETPVRYSVLHESPLKGTTSHGS